MALSVMTPSDRVSARSPSAAASAGFAFFQQQPRQVERGVAQVGRQFHGLSQPVFGLVEAVEQEQ